MTDVVPSLDMSAAFDCVDHSILLNKLSMIGITGGALICIEEYLSRSSHSVKVIDSLSSPASLKYGVPQGFVWVHCSSASTCLELDLFLLDTM
jgi:hypothetical protein